MLFSNTSKLDITKTIIETLIENHIPILALAVTLALKEREGLKKLRKSSKRQKQREKAEAPHHCNSRGSEQDVDAETDSNAKSQQNSNASCGDVGDAEEKQCRKATATTNITA